jgi:hypothetical protein
MAGKGEPYRRIGGLPMKKSTPGKTIGARPLGQDHWGKIIGARPLGQNDWGKIIGFRAFIAHLIAHFIVWLALFDQPESKPRSIKIIRGKTIGAKRLGQDHRGKIIGFRAFIAHLIAHFIVWLALFDQPESKPRSIKIIRGKTIGQDHWGKTIGARSSGQDHWGKIIGAKRFHWFQGLHRTPNRTLYRLVGFVRSARVQTTQHQDH